MTRTTPPPSHRVADLFPALAGRERVTVRLHPRQGPEPADDAGHAMDHLLTVSDTEFDGGTWPRWLAVEDAGAWDGPPDARFAVQSAAGLDFGMGSLYVFICRTCPDWPVAQVYQR